MSVPKGSLKQIYRTAFAFLANPWNLWVFERMEDKRAVAKLVFADTRYTHEMSAIEP